MTQLLPGTTVWSSTGHPNGSAAHYKARLAEVQSENDALRDELHEYRQRDDRRCAFLGGMNDPNLHRRP